MAMPRSRAKPGTMSCSWMNVKGSYEHNGKEDEMIWKSFEVTDSKISGGGSDSVGPFTISGSVSEGKLKFDKVYTGKHTVKYEGGIHKDAASGKLGMGGKWSLNKLSGDWKIWQPAPEEVSEYVSVCECVCRTVACVAFACEEVRVCESECVCVSSVSTLSSASIQTHGTIRKCPSHLTGSTCRSSTRRTIRSWPPRTLWYRFPTFCVRLCTDFVFP